MIFKSELFEAGWRLNSFFGQWERGITFHDTYSASIFPKHSAHINTCVSTAGRASMSDLQWGELQDDEFVHAHIFVSACARQTFTRHTGTLCVLH